jgi:carnitine-CoA ligase
MSADGSQAVQDPNLGADTVWNDTELYPCIGDLVEEAASKWSSRIAIYMPDGELTFDEVARRSRADAGRLFASGVRFGETVASMLDNSLDTITLWLGTNTLGAIHAPINTAYKGEYLRHHIETTQANIVFVENDLQDRVEAVLDQLPAVKMIVVHGGDPLLPSDPRVVRLSLPEWRERFAEPLPADAQKPSPSDVAALIFTSGTTGPAKAVMISHNYMQHAAATHSTFSRPLDGTLYLPFKPFHLAVPAWVVETFMIGAALAVPNGFSVSRFWSDVNRARATTVVSISAMAQLLVNAPVSEGERENQTLRDFFVVPCSPSLRAALEERFKVRVFDNSAYGLTEAVQITRRVPGQPSPPGASGKANARYWVVKIFDDQDREVPAGEVGEIVCRPIARHVMMSGYWQRPADTLAACRNLWFHTGDLGRMDADGNLYFVDRKKDYLRYRGENISSLEVETQFLSHPALLEVAVHAVPSPLGEDDLKVTAVLKPDAALSEEDLAKWSVTCLPYFAVPRYVEFRDELPKNQMGKIQKHELRAQGVTPSTWDMSQSDIQVPRR